MLQASEGGRVYLGRSALEIKLREAVTLGSGESIPSAAASVPTERIARPPVVELPSAPDKIERGVLVSRSTLVGLCLTAFACGIVATVALDHRRSANVEHATGAPEITAVAAPASPTATAASNVVQGNQEEKQDEKQLVEKLAGEPATDVAARAPVRAPAESAAAADPVVVQMAAARASATASVDSPPAEAAPAQKSTRAVAARTPRPAVARTAPVRRHAGPAVSDDPHANVSAPTPAPAAKWVDPFAE